MGKHLQAVEFTIREAGSALNGCHAALLELVRTLASQMDVAGEEPSTRLSAAYLSALKDMTRAISGGSVATARRSTGLGDLRQRRQNKGGIPT